MTIRRNGDAHQRGVGNGHTVAGNRFEGARDLPRVQHAAGTSMKSVALPRVTVEHVLQLAVHRYECVRERKKSVGLPPS